MRAIIKKLYLDFFRSYSKLLLCLLAASLSAWGISTMVYSYVMSERDFKVNFSSTNPADFILTLREPSADLLQLLKRDKNIKAIERREQLYARTKNKDGNWMPMVIYGVTDLDAPSIMRFTITGRDTSVGQPGVYIEGNGRRFIQALDKLQLQVAGDSNLVFHRIGLVHDPGMAPSQMDQLVYGYTAIENIKNKLPAGSQRYLFKTNFNGPSKDELQWEVSRIAKFVEQHGSSVLSSLIPEPGAHPHQGIVDGISVMQRSFGIILNVLGIILLSLILLTWLYPQLSDIGVYKTLGASTRTILFSYVAIVCSIITVGLLIGLPLGYKSALFYNMFIAKLQNFIPVKESLSVSAHLLVIIPALLVPLLVCIIPLIKISRTTVHDALNKIFYTPHQSIFKLTRKIFTNSRIAYGFNNMFRSNQKSILLIALLAIGISLFISVYNLKYSINSEFNNYYRDTNYNVTITLRDTVKGKLNFLDQLPFVEAVAYSKKKKATFQLPGYAQAVSTTLKTFSKEYKVSDKLILEGSVDKQCAGCLFINQSFREDFKDMEPGTGIDVTLNDSLRHYTYGGIYKEIGQGSSFYIFNDEEPGGYKEIMLRVKSDIDLSMATQQIDDALLAHDIDVVNIMNTTTYAASIKAHFEPTYLIIKVMGLFTIVVGIMGVLIVLNLSFKERMREMGIMKALGASILQISYLFAWEYLIANLLACIFGIVAGYGLTWIFCRILASLGMNLELLPKNNYPVILMTTISLLLLQTMAIVGYSNFKLRKTSGNLLNTVV